MECVRGVIQAKADFHGDVADRLTSQKFVLVVCVLEKKSKWSICILTIVYSKAIEYCHARAHNCK